MSEIRLNVLDAGRAINGTIHGGIADAVVAGLSAEPETIEELQDAMARFIKPARDYRPFANFKTGLNDEPWDAGITLVDLAARVVANESTYTDLYPEGSVEYHNGVKATDVWLPYKVPDDWLFVGSIAEYEGVRDERRAERAARQPLDARAVLYGKMAEFIARECIAARESNAEDPVPGIHAKWLMTPRDDLRGQSPREVILRKREFIDLDLQSREVQWSYLKEPAPCLKPESAAYRFAGFGTHETVIYYDLWRHMLSDCWERVSKDGSISIEDEAARLKRVQADWLAHPDTEQSEKSPGDIIELERLRIPWASSASEFLEGADDCPLCRQMAEDMDSHPVFSHLDGSHMEYDFPFSFHLTREEWEEEKREWERFNEEFERRHPDLR